jgi:membrane-bound metal-dependent hydrolase YbcI (DUF457 family)
MFFFLHLLIGFLLSLLVGDLFRDPRWVIPCVIGAGLPDLIDKPLGYMVFSTTINNGRIWFHSLLLLVIVLGMGILAWKFRSTPLGVAAALGIFLHQLLDFMWEQPVSWFYPFLGPFRSNTVSGNLWVLLLREVNHPSEWICCWWCPSVLWPSIG